MERNLLNVVRTCLFMSGLNQHTRIYRKHKLIAGYDCGRDLSIIYALYHISGTGVVDMVVVCHLTGGFLNPRCQSQSLCLWARHFIQTRFCQSAPGQLWLQCSSPLSVCECVYEWVDD
ncbi:hypothetical protein ILYODFUR_025808 [Ilyodon furcidens]|uniref:Uncharacterized protein n=1 Tax=Ilyodon furcidens TaxID=33524 RepID=A0ABV0UKZ6_9TELE